jgi:uncharacterized small protein (DUF1192 family)
MGQEADVTQDEAIKYLEMENEIGRLKAEIARLRTALDAAMNAAADAGFRADSDLLAAAERVVFESRMLADSGNGTKVYDTPTRTALKALAAAVAKRKAKNDESS